MKLGMCGLLDSAATIKAAGFEYLEIHTQQFLKPEMGEEEFAPLLEKIRAADLRVETANCLFPAELKLTGPEAATDRALRIVETACRRAAQAGLAVIVFGSGRSRALPEGTERERGWAQLVDLARKAGDIAARHGVTIVMEPLNRRETNVLNSTTEGMEFVRAVDHPGIRLLVDAYHWAVEGEPPEAIVRAGPYLRHAHIATAANRRAPGQEPQDFVPFFRALRQAGYDGRVSLEARIGDLAAEAPVAFQTMKTAAEAAGYRFSS